MESCFNIGKICFLLFLYYEWFIIFKVDVDLDYYILFLFYFLCFYYGILKMYCIVDIYFFV